MKKRKVLGVRCNVVGPGPPEGYCCVNILSNKIHPLFVLNSSLELTNEEPKRPYFRIREYSHREKEKEYIVWPEGLRGISMITAKESDLVFA